MQTEQFAVGDIVRYATTGVCRIADITEMAIGKQKAMYYVLQPVHKDALQVYVPCDKEALVAKMRRILTKGEILSLIHSMPEVDCRWIADDMQRKETYQQILAQGDRSGLIGMIRAIYLHQQRCLASGKKLHQADERYFEEAQKLLSDEFAYVLGIRPEQVTPFIVEQLEGMPNE